ncbi:PREDICTED: LYR motif-containing protein 4, partial [Galeopterus variegatus]|uniref:LYR motif-containing protein 4 n=1 Tax=Galeopterus variegatus TaxID=482537 RepID=A0ABM0RWK0_GALVR
FAQGYLIVGTLFLPQVGKALCVLTSEGRRTYAVRRIRDAFRENKNVKDPVEIQTLVNKAKRDLEIIRRQPPLRTGPSPDVFPGPWTSQPP